MRIGLALISVIASGLVYGAELPLFFGSGSNFSGVITRHKVQGDPRVEARVSQVDKKLTLRMVVLADRAVVLAVLPAPAEKTFVTTFQIKNDETIFKTAKTALDQKIRFADLAARYRDPAFRADVYDLREYKNKDLIVGLNLYSEEMPNGRRFHLATMILHPADEDNVQGELVIYSQDKTIVETLWFDVKREGELRAPMPVPPTPLPVPTPLPMPTPLPAPLPKR